MRLALSLYVGAIDDDRLAPFANMLNASMNGAYPPSGLGWAPRVLHNQTKDFETALLGNVSLVDRFGAMLVYFPLHLCSNLTELQLIQGSADKMARSERTGTVTALRPFFKDSGVLTTLLLFPIYEPTPPGSFFAQKTSTTNAPLKGFMTFEIEPHAVADRIISNGRSVIITDVTDPLDKILLFSTTRAGSEAEFVSNSRNYVYCGQLQVADRVWSLCEGKPVPVFPVTFATVGAVLVGCVLTCLIAIGVAVAIYFRWRLGTKQEEILHAREATMLMVGHELRTPLLTVSLALEEIFALNINVGELKSNLDLIRAAADIMLNLIRDILDSNKIASGSMKLFVEPFSLPSLAEEVEKIISPIARRSPDVQFVSQVSQFIVEADKARLLQVLINLVSNSFKFTEKGSVTLVLDVVDKSKLLVCVTDTGCGIPDDHMNLLFRKFSQIEATGTSGAFL